MIQQTLGQWSARRWVAVIGLTPLLAAAFVMLAETPLGDLSFGWFALMATAAILSAGVLGSYVPKGGLRPDLGCAPCAVMPVATVVGAMIAVNTYGAAVVGPALASAVTLFGMTQRLSNVTSCDVPAADSQGWSLSPPQVAGSGRGSVAQLEGVDQEAGCLAAPVERQLDGSGDVELGGKQA